MANYLYPGCRVRVHKDATASSPALDHIRGMETTVIGRTFLMENWWDINVISPIPAEWFLNRPNYVRAHASVLEPIIPEGLTADDKQDVTVKQEDKALV